MVFQIINSFVTTKSNHKSALKNVGPFKFPSYKIIVTELPQKERNKMEVPQSASRSVRHSIHSSDSVPVFRQTAKLTINDMFRLQKSGSEFGIPEYRTPRCDAIYKPLSYKVPQDA
jgi:hypothetical protein